MSFGLNLRRSRGGLPNLPNFNTGPLHAQTAEGGPSHLICPGDSVMLGVPDTTGGLVSYTWTPTTGLSDPSSPQPLASPPATRIYYLKVVDSAFGLSCGVTWDSVLVQVATAQEMPQAMAGVDTVICPGGTAMVGGADSAVTGWNYAWSPANQVANPSAFSTSTTVPGQYVLTVSNPISAKACFSDRDTVEVAVYDPSVIPTNPAGVDTFICIGDTVRLGSPGAPPGWSYQWSPFAGLDDPLTAHPLASPSQGTVYHLLAWDSSISIPCAMARDSVTLTVESPIAHPAPEDVTFCPGECFRIGVAPRPGLVYAWSPVQGLESPNQSLTVARSTQTTTFTLSILDPAKQSANCRELRFPLTATADDCHFQTFLWPNGDGVAETLDFGRYEGRLSLEVFDLRGRLVHRAEDYQNAWDGGGLGAGVYVWRLVVSGECGFERTGKVVLMR